MRTELEQHIDEENSTYTDWKYLENVLEWLEDYDCLSENGKRFRKHIWEKYVKGKVVGVKNKGVGRDE